MSHEPVAGDVQGDDATAARSEPEARAVAQLLQRIGLLEAHARREREEAAAITAALGQAREWEMLGGKATAEGTRRYFDGFGDELVAFHREACGLRIANIGIGTNRGNADAATDQDYTRAISAALLGGVNLVDTAINYRHQRAEYAVARGLRAFLDGGMHSRESIIVCSKGGFVVPGAVPRDLLDSDCIAGGIHSLAPAFLADQIERSRRNLGLQTIDIYYLHNPEVQLRFIGQREFASRIAAAFESLEHAVAEGRIGHYGIATWDGYRNGALSLRSLEAIARQVAGDSHHLRFIQVPFNVDRQEARTDPVESDGKTLVESAQELGIALIASASLGQVPVLGDVPPELQVTALDALTPVQRAIQFVRSTPGICTALVGMRRLSHVRENLSIASIPPMATAAGASA